MAESLKNEDKSIRSYILNNVLEKVPIDKSYKNLCTVIGNVAIAFYDFQFWYYRFLSGKQDLDFDRSSEPEPLRFSDLPVDAVGLIVDKLKMVERLKLRRVSKSLREFIEKQVFDCTYIEVMFGSDYIDVSYGKEDILYAKNDEAVKLYEKECRVRGVLILYKDESEVCEDLTCVLKNPKLQLSRFEFWKMFSCVEAGVLSKFFNKLKYALKFLKHQIAVRNLYFLPEHPDDFLAFLPYLKSGYLERITIDGERVVDDWRSDENMRKVERIMQLDQWEQAATLVLLYSLHLFPDEVLVQFKKYSIQTKFLSQNELVRIRDKFAESPIFEYCRFDIKYPEEVDDFLDFIGVPGRFARGCLSVRRYLVPNTDKLLVFKQFTFGDIEIVKKTRRVR